VGFCLEFSSDNFFFYLDGERKKKIFQPLNIIDIVVNKSKYEKTLLIQHSSSSRPPWIKIDG